MGVDIALGLLGPAAFEALKRLWEMRTQSGRSLAPKRREFVSSIAALLELKEHYDLFVSECRSVTSGALLQADGRLLAESVSGAIAELDLAELERTVKMRIQRADGDELLIDDGTRPWWWHAGGIEEASKQGALQPLVSETLADAVKGEIQRLHSRLQKITWSVNELHAKYPYAAAVLIRDLPTIDQIESLTDKRREDLVDWLKEIAAEHLAWVPSCFAHLVIQMRSEIVSELEARIETAFRGTHLDRVETLLTEERAPALALLERCVSLGVRMASAAERAARHLMESDDAAKLAPELHTEAFLIESFERYELLSLRYLWLVLKEERGDIDWEKVIPWLESAEAVLKRGQRVRPAGFTAREVRRQIQEFGSGDVRAARVLLRKLERALRKAAIDELPDDWSPTQAQERIGRVLARRPLRKRLGVGGSGSHRAEYRAKIKKLRKHGYEWTSQVLTVYFRLKRLEEKGLV